ncbi:MAG TPA: ATP-binding protein [Pirellulales bacterium]|jgi:serine/threonine-protein kinase RsbW|nr:ATP-binding protein [Pirellulales bacterium]
MSETSNNWSIRISFPSSQAAGKQVVEQVRERLELAEWSPHDVFSVHLAVEEAIVNAIKHGNRHDASKQVRVACCGTPEKFWIEIIDEGLGFDPDQLPDPTAEENLECPCGRGVLLMRNFMSRVEFSDQGKRVVMEKHRANPRPTTNPAAKPRDLH